MSAEASWYSDDDAHGFVAKRPGHAFAHLVSIGRSSSTAKR